MTELTLFEQLKVTPAIDRWHNTTNLQGEQFKQRQFRAGKLNRRVLDFYKSHSYENYTPWEVSKALGINSAPITSIRRAISDLTEMGYLIRTNIQRPGQYGAPTYAWQLK